MREASITQTWDQGTAGTITLARTYLVLGEEDSKKKPLLVYLHGAGQDFSTLAQLVQPYATEWVVAAPKAYGTSRNNSWNVTTEDSLAPDVDFVEQIISTLTALSHVEPKVVLIGNSNGAALSHRMMIESSLDSIVGAVCMVSQLAEQQYHSGQFWKQNGRPAPSYAPLYNVSTVPKGDRCIAMLVGQDDHIASNEYSSNTGSYKSPAGTLLSVVSSAYAWASVLVGSDVSEKSMYLNRKEYVVNYNDTVWAMAVHGAGHSIPVEISMRFVQLVYDNAPSNAPTFALQAWQWAIIVAVVIAIIVAVALVIWKSRQSAKGVPDALG